MKILHVSPHYGGGIGTVVSGLIKNDNCNAHRLYSLELCKEKKVSSLFVQMDDLRDDMKDADIVLVHYWDHPTLTELFSKPLPPCRLVFWVHKHYRIAEREICYPDRCFGTSPIQFLPDYIWSTGDISRFLEIKPKEHKGFNVGYVGTVDYKKIHPNIFKMCNEIGRLIPDSRFTFVGENKTNYRSETGVTFTGKVDDIAPYLAEMDIFGYPLRPDHYGTCEQALGEAMAAGVVPVTMNNPCERMITLQYGSEDEESKYEDMIEFLYLNPDCRKELSSEMRKTAQRIYSLDTMISQWNDVFESMMEQPKKVKGVL
jgi:glycosyltransferase involved in cell wall biosynthesis